jgi:UV DNA damage endonuclease
VSLVTIVKLGYVAMSMNLKNSSPSQTMTLAQFKKIKDKEAAIGKLERIARSNINNCLRLLKYNLAHDIHFFRLSSRLIPLAGHEELAGWKFMRPLKEPLKEIADFLQEHPMRIGFHPDHFVVFTTNDSEILKQSLKNLKIHEALLRGMGIDQEHRCVIHIGGAYDDKEKSLERFISNWGNIPAQIQRMIMLENDDTTFNLQDTLYLCEKLSVPIVFDYHHHLAYHEHKDWKLEWERIVGTWKHSTLPLKMHISSPRNEKEFRAHADYIDVSMFMDFLSTIKGSIEELDCMIEAKEKDNALFKLMEDIKKHPEIEVIDDASFKIR